MTPARTLPHRLMPKTNKPRERRRKDTSLIKGSIGHRKVHIYRHSYTYRSINSIERVHLEPKDHHHRWWPPSRLILGYLPTGVMPPYHSALGHPRVHRNAEIVRHSTRPQWSLLSLRRVWAKRPYLPTLSTFNLGVVAPS